MHYLYRYVCILNVFYMCIWTIVCNKEFIIMSHGLNFNPSKTVCYTFGHTVFEITPN